MNYKEFYTDSLDIFMRFINVNLKIESNYDEIMTVASAMCSYYGYSYFNQRFLVSIVGVFERRFRQTGEEKYDINHYKAVLGNVWRFHKAHANIQHNDDFRCKVDADYKKIFQTVDNKLEKELLLTVRSSLMLQSFEFEDITDNVKKRWRLEPLLPRQKGGKAWGKR